MNDGLMNSTAVYEALDNWSSLLGEYPRVWIDHSGNQQNFAKNGSRSESDYYINDLRNDSSLTYVWVNYGTSWHDYPSWFNEDNNILAHNSSLFNDTLNETVTNIFQSTGTERLNSNYFYQSDINYLSAERGLYLPHTYTNRYVFKELGGTNYSTFWYAMDTRSPTSTTERSSRR